MRTVTKTNVAAVVVAAALGCSLAACAFDESELDEVDEESIGEIEQEATAYHTGWHTVCANSLTFNRSTYDTWLRYGDHFYINHFTLDGRHVWGWGYTDDWVDLGWGWVNNGWFC